MLTLLLFLSFQNSIPLPWKSESPAFSDITVTSSSKHLLFFAMLDKSFTEEMKQGLHSGLPIHFSFFIELAPTNQDWDSKSVTSLKTNHIIQYDTLKDTYTVEIEESGKRFYTFDSLEQAQKAANEINGFKVIELARIRPGTSYAIRIRAELYKKTLPMGLHEFIPFVSWWDVKTQWHSITFNL